MNVSFYIYLICFYVCIKLFYLIIFKIKKIELEESIFDIAKTSTIELLLILICLGSCLELMAIFGDSNLNVITIFLGILPVSILPISNFIILPIYFTLSNKLEKFQWESCSSKKYSIYISDKVIYNAYSTGVLPFSKSIIIGRKLMEELEADELNAILLHEVGHLEKNHLQKSFFYNLFVSMIGVLGLFYFLPFYKSTSYEVVLIMAHSIFFFCILMFVGTAILQRYFELEADGYSALNLSKESISSALIKLDKLTNGEVSQGGLNYPSLQKRLININKVSYPYNSK